MENYLGDKLADYALDIGFAVRKRINEIWEQYSKILAERQTQEQKTKQNE